MIVTVFRHPEHVAAPKAGRDSYYEEYRVQSCEVLRDSKFARNDSAA
jgi:heme-degrading monooxygenase HmoA